MSFLRKHALWVLLLNIVMSALVLTAVLPLPFTSREEIFEIPAGTWASRMAGKQLDILPQTIYLALGVRDILVLRNNDTVPQMFGPTLIMPNQSFSLPFELASAYQFACTAHLNGQMTVVVDPEPRLGWPRLSWRMTKLWRRVSNA